MQFAQVNLVFNIVLSIVANPSHERILVQILTIGGSGLSTPFAFAALVASSPIPCGWTLIGIAGVVLINVVFNFATLC